MCARTGINTKEVQQYLQQQAPNIFQQTASKNCDLVASVLHKNALDLYISDVIEDTKHLICTSTTPAAFSSKTIGVGGIPGSDDKYVTKMSQLGKLFESVNTLKCENENLLVRNKASSVHINILKGQQGNLQKKQDALRKTLKMHERTCVVLENPQENVKKLDLLVHSSQEKRKTLQQQWQEYRQPMCENIETLKNAKKAKNMQDVTELGEIISQLEQSLREKSSLHAKINAELRGTTVDVAPRKEYTRRIMEFIGNIRKQRNDIYKVLDDTRDLQKQLNSVTAQLQRQFNYTDDLLFQSAKHDLHAKRAYKLLASLHATCNELVNLVSQSGNITKDIRDLEVQIDREKLKSIALSLEQISADIRNFENVIRSIQSEVENEITM